MGPPISTISPGPGGPSVCQAELLTVLAALAVKVNDVLLCMEATVPINCPPAVVLYKFVPGLTVVKNIAVADPVTVVEAVEEVTVPARPVVGHVFAELQFPDATAEIVACPKLDTFIKDMTTKNASVNTPDLPKNLFINENLFGLAAGIKFLIACLLKDKV